MRRSSMTVVAATATTLSVALAFGQSPRLQQKPAVAPNAAKQAAPAPAREPMTMQRLLKLWEKQSSRLKTLDVAIKRVDKSDAWGDQAYQGHASLKSPNFAFLHFDKLDQENGKEKAVPYERIVCTGTEVWQYKFDVQQVFIYPLDREQRKRALEEGPLPFLFNMNASEAEKRYVMTLLKESDTAYLIDVQPRLQIDQESFSRAYVLLDRTYLLPTRILLRSPNGKDTKDFSLSDMKANKPVDDADFKGQPVKAPWKIVRNPMGDGAPQNPPAKDARQPALKNAARPGRR